MLNQLYTRRHVLSRLRAGLFGLYLELLVDALYQQGHTLNTIRNHLYAYDKFGQWMVQQGYSLTDTSQSLIDQYRNGLERKPSGGLPKAGLGLGHLLRWLQQEGIIVEPKRPLSEADRWLARYETYLEQVMGAALGTRRAYRPIVRSFLASHFATGAVSWETLSAEAITEFVQQAVNQRQRAGRRLVCTAMRSLLRFLVFSGELQPGLEAAVPTVRCWPDATLPQRLSAEQVEQLLASCDTATPWGLRDRAILLLLARLGLRARELARLHLDDIDWRQNQLRIRAGKTHRDRVLPLSQEVGEALVAYLVEARPQSSHRAVFLTGRPPFRPFAGPGSVSWVVLRAARRAGFPPSLQVGAHVLRHSAASQMVCQGASFKAVADVLGHGSLQTTGIYAKLDLAHLEQVALPWPGGAQ